jgi:hypothetical protein
MVPAKTEGWSTGSEGSLKVQAYCHRPEGFAPRVSLARSTGNSSGVKVTLRFYAPGIPFPP